MEASDSTEIDSQGAIAEANARSLVEICLLTGSVLVLIVKSYVLANAMESNFLNSSTIAAKSLSLYSAHRVLWEYFAGWSPTAVGLLATGPGTLPNIPNGG